MKKFLTIFSVLALVLSLAACGSASKDEGSQAPATTTPGSTTQPSSQVPTVESTAPSASAPAFSEIVLTEDENVTVKITGIEENGILGYTLKVFLENKTDLELMFTVENVSVNGFMIDPFWADTVDGGKKANEEISFLKSDFEKNGISSVEQIQLTLRVYDNDDWLADDIFNETITITP